MSSVGRQRTPFAGALPVYRLTGSFTAVGGVGLAAAAPSVVVGPFGGPLIDSVDGRLPERRLRGPGVTSATLAR